MPLDRRNPGLLGRLIAFLPWSAQEVLNVVLFERPEVKLLLSAVLLTVAFGPWPVAVLLLAKRSYQAWSAVRRSLTKRAKTYDGGPQERAVWLVRQPFGKWWYWIARRTGWYWLPASAPVLGGDVLLFDARSEGSQYPANVQMAARLQNPMSKGSKRRRGRLVRLASLWFLQNPLEVSTLPDAARVWTDRSVYALTPIDEKAIGYKALEAKSSASEERKPTWRAERQAHNLLHKLWGMHKFAEPYDKPTWGRLQSVLHEAGLYV